MTESYIIHIYTLSLTDRQCAFSACLGPVVVLALECDNGVARLLSLVHPTQSSTSAPAAPLSSYRQRLGYGLSHVDEGHDHGLFTGEPHSY